MSQDAIWRPLGELADIQYGWTAKASVTAHGPRMLRITDIQNGRVNWDAVPRCEMPRDRLAGFLLHPGDIVFARIGATTGKSYLIGNDVPEAVFASYLIRVRPRSELRSDFLAYFFQSADYWAHIHRESRGIGRPAVNGKLLSRLVVPVPSPEEQRRMVAAVDYYLPQVDEGVRHFTAALDGAAVMRHAVSERCWTHCSVEHLQDLLEAPLKNGRSVQTAEQGFPVLRLTALRDGVVDTSAAKVGAWTDELARPYLVRRDDFLVSRGNGTLRLVGRGALVMSEPPPVAFPDTLIRVRVNESRLTGRFLRLVWNSQRVRSQIEGHAHTSAGIYKVNQDMLRLVELPVPPLEEQERLVAEIEGQMAALASLEGSLRTQLARAEELKRAVLHCAFSGRLVPQHPLDNPVSGAVIRVRDEARGRAAAERNNSRTVLVGE